LDTFDGRSNTAYKQWLAAVQPTTAKHDYASFVTKKVADQADGVWTTGTIQCLHQDILQSMTRTLPADTITTNKSHPFSIVWADNTDSICDLSSVLTFFGQPCEQPPPQNKRKSIIPGDQRKCS
jgi:hypothetical protein